MIAEEENISEWLALSNKILSVSELIFTSAQIPVTSKGAADPEVLLLTLLARTAGNFKGVLTLQKADLIIEARTLVRSCLENLFHMVSLDKKGDSFVTELFHDEMASRKNRAKFIQGNPKRIAAISDKQRNAFDAYLKNIEEQFPKVTLLRPRNIASDGEAEDLYIFYSELCADSAHPTTTSLSRHIVDECSIDIYPPSDKGEWCYTLEIGCCSLLGASKIADKLSENEAAKSALLVVTEQFCRIARR